jgi:hypothetical protein
VSKVPKMPKVKVFYPFIKGISQEPFYIELATGGTGPVSGRILAGELF